MARIGSERSTCRTAVMADVACPSSVAPYHEPSFARDCRSVSKARSSRSTQPSRRWRPGSGQRHRSASREGRTSCGRSDAVRYRAIRSGELRGIEVRCRVTVRRPDGDPEAPCPLGRQRAAGPVPPQAWREERVGACGKFAASSPSDNSPSKNRSQRRASRFTRPEPNASVSRR